MTSVTSKKPPSLVIPSKLFEHLESGGGNLMFVFNPYLEQDPWMVAYRRGQEITDGSYGVGPSATDAFSGMIRELFPPQDDDA